MFDSKISEMESECEEMMIGKFGCIVDLEKLETVTVNRTIEELKEKLRMTEIQCSEDVQEWNVSYASFIYNHGSHPWGIWLFIHLSPAKSLTAWQQGYTESHCSAIGLLIVPCLLMQQRSPGFSKEISALTACTFLLLSPTILRVRCGVGGGKGLWGVVTSDWCISLQNLEWLKWKKKDKNLSFKFGEKGNFITPCQKFIWWLFKILIVGKRRKNEWNRNWKENICISLSSIRVDINILKIMTPKIFTVITLKFLTRWLYHRVMRSKDADGMANSFEPDQTAPLGAVWTGSTQFAQT